MAAITHYSCTYANSTGPTDVTTAASWDDDIGYNKYAGTYTSDQCTVPEEPPTKQSPFGFWLAALFYPSEELHIEPEKPPPKKRKIIFYFNVKLARAPPWAFFV